MEQPLSCRSGPLVEPSGQQLHHITCELIYTQHFTCIIVIRTLHAWLAREGRLTGHAEMCVDIQLLYMCTSNVSNYRELSQDIFSFELLPFQENETS